MDSWKRPTHESEIMDQTYAQQLELQLNKTRDYLEVDNLEACYFQGYDQIFIKKNTKSILSGSILGASIIVATKILLSP